MAEEKLIRFTEDEDMARARAFWQQNGRPIIVGIVLGLAGIGGYTYWQHEQQRQGESASVLYEQVRAEAEEEAAVAGKALKEDYGNTIYAAMGAFFLAKAAVEQEQYAVAEEQLQWVVDHSADSGMQHIARARLASLFLAQERYDEALKLLSAVASGPFSSRYKELLADAYVGRNGEGDIEKARQHYEASLAELRPGSGNGTILQLKIDNLGAR